MELSIPTEGVLEVLKHFAMPKRGIEVRCGVMATLESGQLTKGEVRLLGSVTGDTISGNYELVLEGTHLPELNRAWSC